MVTKCVKQYQTLHQTALILTWLVSASDVFMDCRAAGVPNEQAFVLMLWMFRYLRRRSAIFGEAGDPLADKTARDLLTARNRAQDVMVTTLPDWDAPVRALVRLWMGATHHAKRMDVKSPAEPHGYGPSLRRLWAEAGKLGRDPWEHVQNWALHLPQSFQGYDPDEFFSRYKTNANKAMQQEMSPKENKQVMRVLAKTIEWRSTGDLTVPWSAGSGRKVYRVRLNDFPDQWMYSLIVDETELGDFHDWPDTWKRAPQKPPARPAVGKRLKLSAPIPVEVDPGQLLSRYQNGEHEAVWSDLQRLGEGVREPRYLEAARAVSRETMRRAQRNVETIVSRLHDMNYRFLVLEPPAAQRGDQPFMPAPLGAAEQLRKLEREGMILPLSLEAWVEHVGSVNLMGAHPKLCFLEEEEGFPYVFADPLIVDVSLGSIRGEDATDGIDWVIAPDAEGKAGDSEPDFYFVRLPDCHADIRFRGERHKTNFVDYLRLAFRWGGFPGWEQYDERPEKELAALTEGLLAI